METSIFGQDTTNMGGVNGVTDTSSSLEQDNTNDMDTGAMNDGNANNGASGNTGLENSDLNNAADSATEAESESNNR